MAPPAHAAGEEGEQGRGLKPFQPGGKHLLDRSLGKNLAPVAHKGVRPYFLVPFNQIIRGEILQKPLEKSLVAIILNR